MEATDKVDSQEELYRELITTCILYLAHLLSPQPANISHHRYIETAIAAASTIAHEDVPIENGVRTVLLQIGPLGASNQFVHWRLSCSTGLHVTTVQPVDPNQPSTSQQ